MDTTSPTRIGAEGTEDADALLAQADALRDGGDWIEAAVAYAAYLRLRPEDWPIWVQYGHCMKESGDTKAALLLYREAERLQPADSDLHVQIGHALKLLGRVEEAYQAYAKALTLDSANAAARAELLATPAGQAPPPAAAERAAPPPTSPAAAARPPAAPAGPAAVAATAAPAASAPAAPGPAAPTRDAPPPAVPAAPSPAPAAARPPAAPRPPPAAAPGLVAEGGLLFDASDLLDYFRHNRAPTGIQRVQLNIIGAALDAAPDLGLVAFDPVASAWKALPAETFRRLAQLSATGAEAGSPDWTGAVAGALGGLLQSAPAALPHGGRLVNLGTSWWIPDYLRRIREAKAELGLRYVPMLYDCIPLVAPEHCAAGLVDQFARWFAGLCLHADAVLCISECTRADFRRLSRALLPPGVEVPGAVLRLDAAPVPPPREAIAAASTAAAPPLRAGRPYVLFVGTIESRKNHLMVFNAWLSLLRRHGAEAVPDLVCVGKRGWLAEAALALHANSPALQARVHLLHAVSDAALEALYRGCLFTVYNSFYEGWGLPVTESLAHGKVPVVPDHSSLRESGGEGAVYFAPQSEPDLVAQLERLVGDAPFRAAQEARIAAGAVRLRSWAELTAELLRLVSSEALASPAAPPAAPLARVGLRPGAIHPLRLLDGPEPSVAMAVADALREGPCWSVLEPWGAWTLPGTARLRLPVPEGGMDAGPLRLHLDLLGPPPGPVRVGLRAVLPGRPPAEFRMVEVGAGERVLCTLDLPEAAAGEGAAPIVELDCPEGVPLGGGPGAADLRTVGVGVTAVMACRPDDLAARLDWLERTALPRLVRA